MNITKVLIDAFKILLYKSIEEKGIRDLETMILSEKLDKLILNLQMKEYSKFKSRLICN